MNRLHLLVTGLCPDFGTQTEAAVAGVAVPALLALLGRGRPLPATTAAGVSERLAELFGLVRDPDWPIAPLRLAADGIEPGGGQWWCADPVHLELMLDHLRLGGGSRFDHTAAEAAALVASLNDHFAGEVAFLAPTPLRWYARFARPPSASTTPLDQARGRSVGDCLPQGKDAGRLQQVMNEVQMLCHAHPVNRQREAQGLEPVNSLWFWGGGRWHPPRPLPGQALADSAPAQALARAAGTPMDRLPERFDPACLQGGDGLVVLDSLLPLSCDGRIADWQAELARLEAAWFRPLLAALRAGRIGELQLEVLGPAGAARRLRRLDAWRFWRGPGTLCPILSR
jgi:hypothetical protein